jgi:DNA modification methylase
MARSETEVRLSTNVIYNCDSRLVIPRISTPINMVLTDPPYGMTYESNSAQTLHGKRFTSAIEGDMSIAEAIKLFYEIMGPIVNRLSQDAELYVWTAHHVLEWWLPAVRNLAFLTPDGTVDNQWIWDTKGRQRVASPSRTDNGIRYKMMLVWDKGDPGQGDLLGNWGCGHEVCLYLKRGRRELPQRRSAVLHYPRIPAGKNIHPTQKPTSVLKELIRMSSSPGDLIVDPFSGSGSTSVAAKELGRNSLAFEIDKDYYERSQVLLSQEYLFTG